MNLSYGRVCVSTQENILLTLLSVGVWRQREVLGKKLLRGQTSSDYIRAEVARLVPLQHPNLVRVYGVCVTHTH